MARLIVSAFMLPVVGVLGARKRADVSVGISAEQDTTREVCGWQSPPSHVFCSRFVQQCSQAKGCNSLSPCCEKHSSELQTQMRPACSKMVDTWSHIRAHNLCPALQSSIDVLMSEDAAAVLDDHFFEQGNITIAIDSLSIKLETKPDNKLAYPAQGYKVHILGSEDSVGAILVSCKVAAYLKEKQYYWKTWTPLGIVEAGLYADATQKYKTVTIYPPRDDDTCTHETSGGDVDSCPNANNAYEVARVIDFHLRECQERGDLRAMDELETVYLASMSSGNSSEQQFSPGSRVTYRYGQLRQLSPVPECPDGADGIPTGCLPYNKLRPVDIKGMAIRGEIVDDDRQSVPDFIKWSLEEAGYSYWTRLGQTLYNRNCATLGHVECNMLLGALGTLGTVGMYAIAGR